jgi:hypothetical protein
LVAEPILVGQVRPFRDPRVPLSQRYRLHC